MDMTTSNPARIVTAVLASLAAGLSALLLYQSQTLNALPGCGGGSGCGVVLSSRWAFWFGVPVSLPALLLYTAMLAAVIMREPASKKPQRPALFVMAICAVAAMFAAAWFVSVQILIIKSLCKYCLATHLVGVTASVLCLAVVSAQFQTKALIHSSIAGLLMVCILVGGQILADPPEAAAPKVLFTDAPLDEPPDNTVAIQPPPIEDTTPLTPVEDIFSRPKDPAPTPVPQANPDTLKNVLLLGGRIKTDLTGAPIIGRPDAEKLLVCLFDYTCSHCRTTRGMLEKTKVKHGDSLAIICLPVPLDSKCNYLIKRRNYTNRYACDLAVVSLAFWKVSPQKWERFDRMLYSDETKLTPVRSRIAAEKLVDAKKLKKAMEDDVINYQINKSVRLYEAAARAGGESMLPMLIAKHGVMNGTPRHPLDLDNFIQGQQPPKHQDHAH